MFRRVLIVLVVASALAASGCGGSDGPESLPDGGQGQVTNEPYVPTDEPDEPTADPLDLVVQRVLVGQTPSTSIECYTFYAGGHVELRHNGEVSDSGSYYGDPSGGDIEWSSGRTSSVTSDATAFYVDGTEASEIETCE